MHTFLTPEPITIEIRNASGEIRVDLADVATTTVDVVASSSHPLGFLDDVIRAAKAAVRRRSQAFAGGRAAVRRPLPTTTVRRRADDPAERVRVDLRATPPTGSGARR